jgi:transcriptional antiterminator
LVLFPYQRLAYLFDVIQSEVLPQEELAKRFSVSSRTIRTDIITLNEILAEYGAKVTYERNIGYRLVIDDQELFASLPQAARQVKPIPRTTKERVKGLLLRFLTSSAPIKLDHVADEWFVSRGTLQQDMIEVKESLQKYQLTLDKRPHYGMKVLGSESMIRNCITDIFWQMKAGENKIAAEQQIQDYLVNIDLTYIEKILQNSLDRFDIKLANEALQYLSINCAVSIVRITTSHEIVEQTDDDIDMVVQKASREITKGLIFFLGNEISDAELAYLQIQISARRISESSIEIKNEVNSSEVVDNILNYINNSYNYDLRHDEKLRNDLTTHLAAMITRVKYQVSTPNPLLEDIKKYYPFAYDVTLSAMSKIENAIPYPISEDEMGYLAVHIGVGLERSYNAGYERHPHILIVSDSGNSVLRMIEAKILRPFPQIIVQRVISLREYEQLNKVDEDFVITTVRLPEKDKPIVKIALFPTPYQIEQIGRLVMVDRTKPYLLERFFNEKHFMIVNGAMTQEALFKRVCEQLEEQDYINSDFYDSLVERESIVSTMLGEGIAIPHSLGLLAKKTAVVAILAPDGIIWSNKDEVAHVIFLLAISKDDYEEAMAIYDLFVTFIREKATKRLTSSKSFSDFQSIAKDSLGRSV